MGERVARQTVAAPRRSLCVRSARTKQKDNLAMADPFDLAPKLPYRSLKHFWRNLRSVMTTIGEGPASHILNSLVPVHRLPADYESMQWVEMEQISQPMIPNYSS